MLYWECKRRLAALRQFRILAVDYFENVQHVSWMAGGAPVLDEVTQKTRHQINQMLEDVVPSFVLLGIAHQVYYQPTRAGEIPQVVNLISNMFQLWQFRIGPERVLDAIDRGIGAYERECRRLFKQNFNPFYWIGVFIVWVIRLPFGLLSAIGFNASAFEATAFGKIFKLIWAAIAGLALLLPAVFEVHDHWSVVIGFARHCRGFLQR